MLYIHIKLTRKLFTQLLTVTLLGEDEITGDFTFCIIHSFLTRITSYSLRGKTRCFYSNFIKG